MMSHNTSSLKKVETQLSYHFSLTYVNHWQNRLLLTWKEKLIELAKVVESIPTCFVLPSWSFAIGTWPESKSAVGKNKKRILCHCNLLPSPRGDRKSETVTELGPCRVRAKQKLLRVCLRSNHSTQLHSGSFFYVILLVSHNICTGFNAQIPESPSLPPAKKKSTDCKDYQGQYCKLQAKRKTKGEGLY